MSRRFLVNFLKNPLRNASVVPSSRHAAQEMLSGIDFDSVRYIVELGPGTGVFTRELLDRINPEAEILAIELENSYVEKLAQSGNEQLEVVLGSACELAEHVERRGWPQVDLVVSSLPFVLPKDVKMKLFSYLLQCTEAGSTMRWFTYMPAVMKLHYKDFDLRLHSFVMRNFPPMWVYTVN